ncbi:hypothetical protein CYMTET_48136 [Cymbomonas tetramitiformis]|uniref:Uncharacterized protein n=1 Tax=Cymbomonas tetramitiformis TaxID=36881 RepID=A0AAE0BUG3_9CHLO|nr:hypothetical protein CYMTET_48136 [Cymbomonas tetramitiformis]
MSVSPMISPRSPRSPRPVGSQDVDAASAQRGRSLSSKICRAFRKPQTESAKRSNSGARAVRASQSAEPPRNHLAAQERLEQRGRSASRRKILDSDRSHHSRETRNRILVQDADPLFSTDEGPSATPSDDSATLFELLARSQEPRTGPPASVHVPRSSSSIHNNAHDLVTLPTPDFTNARNAFSATPHTVLDNTPAFAASPPVVDERFTSQAPDTPRAAGMTQTEQKSQEGGKGRAALWENARRGPGHLLLALGFSALDLVFPQHGSNLNQLVDELQTDGAIMHQAVRDGPIMCCLAGVLLASKYTLKTLQTIVETCNHLGWLPTPPTTPPSQQLPDVAVANDTAAASDASWHTSKKDHDEQGAYSNANEHSNVYFGETNRDVGHWVHSDGKLSELSVDESALHVSATSEDNTRNS